ncbi:MAG TPA: hypothetical protein VHT91_00360 [Kofleriaceae bacterium]|jgi:hypothetical protein|nr:hypothetical protein [Kofleriaceae bacterium]
MITSWTKRLAVTPRSLSVPQREDSVKLSRLKIGLLAAAVCTTALFVGARVASADAHGCTFGSSDNNVLTCITITSAGHGGLFVSEMEATAEVVDSARKLQVCIHGPASALPRCSDFEVVHPGDPPLTVQWFPNGDVPGGDYCARTWRMNDDGSHTLIGEACENVHS